MQYYLLNSSIEMHAENPCHSVSHYKKSSVGAVRILFVMCVYCRCLIRAMQNTLLSKFVFTA